MAPRRAIVCYLDDSNRHLLQQTRALRESWLHVRSPDTDLVVMGPAEVLARLPDDVVKIPQRPAADDPVWGGYRSINSIACMNAAGAERLDRYSHLLRTDVDTFITPAWNEFRPTAFTVGIGADANNEDIGQRIRAVAGQHGLVHRGLANVGSTWYGPAEVVRRACATAERVTKHLLTHEFAADEGTGTGWSRGMAVKYAGEIAVNHCAPDAQRSDLLDAPSTSGEPIARSAHIHCRHTDDELPKPYAMADQYTAEDAKGLDLGIVRDYCVAMAFRALDDPAGPQSMVVGLRDEVDRRAQSGLNLAPELKQTPESLPDETITAVVAEPHGDASRRPKRRRRRRRAAAGAATKRVSAPPTALRQLLGTDAAYADFPKHEHPPGFSAPWSGGQVLDRLIAEQRPRRIIEVGSGEGASAIHMARTCAKQGVACKEILCVDTWTGSAEGVVDRLGEGGVVVPSPELHALRYRWGYPQLYHRFLSNVLDAGVQAVITPVPLTTDAAYATLAKIGATADLVHIGGARDVHSLLGDLHMYWDLVAPGGRLFGGGYDSSPEVRAAVEAFAHEVNLIYEVDDDTYVVRRVPGERPAAADSARFAGAQTDYEANLPLVSCVCVTYGRPPSHQYLIEEAIEAFLRQTYPHKELIVLNDCPEQELVCDAPGVRVVNAPVRFATLGEKYNAAVGLARGELLAPWADDGISLPWRLSRSVERLGDAGYFNAKRFWVMVGDELLPEPRSTNGHTFSLFSRAAFEEAGGYPSVGSDAALAFDFDSALRARVTSVGHGIAGQGAPTTGEIYYIHRRGDSSADPPTATSPTDRAADADARHGPAGAGQVQGGRFVLHPHWRRHYGSSLMTRGRRTASPDDEQARRRSGEPSPPVLSPERIGVFTPTYDRPDFVRALAMQMALQARKPDVLCIHQNGDAKSYEWAVADLPLPFVVIWLHTPEKIPQDEWYRRPLGALLDDGCTHFFWCDHDDLYRSHHIARSMAMLTDKEDPYDFVVNGYSGVLALKKTGYEYRPSNRFSAHGPDAMASSMAFNRAFAKELFQDLGDNNVRKLHSDQVVKHVTMPKFRCKLDTRQAPSTIYVVHPRTVSSWHWLGEGG